MVTLRLKGMGVRVVVPDDAGFPADAVEAPLDAGFAADAVALPDARVTTDAGFDPDTGLPIDAGPMSFLLEVEKLGGGQGVIQSAPMGIDCNPDCRARFASGTRVTLTASASRAPPSRGGTATV